MRETQAAVWNDKLGGEPLVRNTHHLDDSPDVDPVVDRVGSGVQPKVAEPDVAAGSADTGGLGSGLGRIL
ncbi:hypothetical protein [Nocardia sp. CNY236]|uniref:hypothetical protein n=1 Tax=Nocardia sp. CNY236 TaxID=1169152 RepID=UPI0012DDBDB4|nr:hypothetical protein [Nocardia sp. CNY236]